MKKIKALFIVLCLLFVAFLVGAYFLPANYRVERSVTINAKARNVYPWINTLKDWPKWTVWTTNMDPSMQLSFSGPEAGTNAVYTWTGQKVGSGRLTVTRSEKDKGVWYELDFEQGKYLSQGGLLLNETGDSTRVTWYNGGELGYNPVNRYFGLMMDRMMGPDFERGLDNLKRIVEAKR